MEDYGVSKITAQTLRKIDNTGQVCIHCNRRFLFYHFKITSSEEVSSNVQNESTIHLK
jgi:hypothetical protein